MSDTTSKEIYVNNSLGYDLPVKIPFSTPEEYDALVGEKDAWFKTVCAGECYSGWNPKFGEAFCLALSEATGVARPTNKKKGTKPGEMVDKPLEPRLFRNLLLAGTFTTVYKEVTNPDGTVTKTIDTEAQGSPVKLTPEQCTEIAQKVAADLPVLDVSPKARASNKAQEELVAQGNVALARLATRNITTQEDLAAYAARVAEQYPGAPLVDEGETYDALAIGKLVAFVIKAQAAAATLV